MSQLNKIVLTSIVVFVKYAVCKNVRDELSLIILTSQDCHIIRRDRGEKTKLARLEHIDLSWLDQGPQKQTHLSSVSFSQEGISVDVFDRAQVTVAQPTKAIDSVLQAATTVHVSCLIE